MAKENVFSWELPFTNLIRRTTSLIFPVMVIKQARFWISEKLFRILQTAFSPDALDFSRLHRQHSPQGFARSRNFSRTADASAVSPSDLQEEWPWRDKAAGQWACPPGKARCSITGPRVTKVSVALPVRYIEEVPYPQWSLADTEDLPAQ